MSSHKIIHSWLRLSPKLRRDFVLYTGGLYGRYKLPQAILQVFKRLSDEEVKVLNTGTLVQLVESGTPSITCTNKNLLNSLSDLNNWLHEYLVLDYLKRPEQKAEYDILRLKAFVQHKLSHDFNRVEKRLTSYLDGLEYQNTDTYLQFFQLRQIQIDTPWSDGLSSDKSSPTDDLLKYLEKYYMNFKLKLGLEMINRNKLLNENHLVEGLDSLIIEAEKKAESDKIIKAHLLCIKIFKNWSAEDYNELNDLFLNGNGLPLQNQLDILQVLLNYCYRKMRESNSASKYSLRSFSLLKEGLSRKILTYRGYMYHSHFQGIVMLACRKKEFEWAYQFIQNWKHYLTDEMKDIEQFCLAYLYFNTGKYDDIQLLLNEMTFKNVFLEFNCRAIQLQAQYEMGWSRDIMTNQIKTFKKFAVRKGRLNDSYKAGALDFAKCLQYLITARCNFLEMQEYFVGKSPLNKEKWFLEKAKENELNMGSE